MYYNQLRIDKYGRKTLKKEVENCQIERFWQIMYEVKRFDNQKFFKVIHFKHGTTFYNQHHSWFGGFGKD